MNRVEMLALNNSHAPLPMLTFGSFSLVIAAFLGCVWWACQDEQH